MKLEIVLALNSPLYVPVYFAHRMTGGMFTIRVAQTPNPTAGARDDFVYYVLSRRSQELRVGIGDPMRIASVEANSAQLYQPRIAGALIGKMCYWLVNGSEARGDAINWDVEFDKVLVHPHGMTGYTLACYDYCKRREIAIEKDPSETEKEYESRLGYLKKLIHSSVVEVKDPNHDVEEYLEERRENSRIAVLTTNPLYARCIPQEHDPESCHTVLSFPRYPTTATKLTSLANIYSSSLMTALIVRNEENNSTISWLIEEFLAVLGLSLEAITQDPEAVARDLYLASRKSALKFELVGRSETTGKTIEPFFQDWKAVELGAWLKYCVNDLEIYVKDVKDKGSTQALLLNAGSMRTSVEPLLPWHERRRTATEIVHCFA